MREKQIIDVNVDVDRNLKKSLGPAEARDENRRSENRKSQTQCKIFIPWEIGGGYIKVVKRGTLGLGPTTF